MSVVLIGSNGFIGKNLKLKLQEEKINYFEVTKKTSLKKLKYYCLKAEVLVHAAGQNISKFKKDFNNNNILITDKICNLLKQLKKKPKIIYLSTTKINENSFYGLSKKKAENILINFAKKNNSPLNILRLPNVYGKWCKPNYNSFVTTMFYNIPRGINFKKINLQNKINLIHIDTVINKIFSLIKKKSKKLILDINAEKVLSIKDLLNKINEIWYCHKNGYLYNYKTNFERTLYSSFLTYLPSKNFFRSIKKFEDKRGMFSELLKNKNYGQISMFSINPGETRGKHYHNIKNEKFIVLSGTIIFKMKSLNDGKLILKKINEKNIGEIISVPGWSHEIKNSGKQKAIILLWSNEIYDNKNPDTYYKPI